MKQRQVGIELLRIISMMMVLGLHANFMGIGVPSPDKILSGPEILQVLMQSLCIVAVNVFVMISGWFGIRPSVKGFCNFMGRSSLWLVQPIVSKLFSSISQWV